MKYVPMLLRGPTKSRLLYSGFTVDRSNLDVYTNSGIEQP